MCIVRRIRIQFNDYRLNASGKTKVDEEKNSVRVYVYARKRIMDTCV